LRRGNEEEREKRGGKRRILPFQLTKNWAREKRDASGNGFLLTFLEKGGAGGGGGCFCSFSTVFTEFETENLRKQGPVISLHPERRN